MKKAITNQRHSYSQITQSEREEIAIFRELGLSIREIARQLGRSPSSISRELRRNQPPINKCNYRAHSAQKRANDRKRKAHKRKRLKNEQIHAYVVAMLKIGWSPELIAGRLSLDFPHLKISYEAIYQWIYTENRAYIAYLPRGHRKRRKRGSCKNKRAIKIPNRISIKQRSEEANLRAEFGHLEADTAVNRCSLFCICVSIDRMTRMCSIIKMKNCSSQEMHDALIKSWSYIAETNKIKSITYDNGKENTKHELTNLYFDSKSFFARPYRSCDKGSVEQVIGLIRRYLPKKTDFALISQETLDRIAYDLNTRPRKCLGYKSPFEALSVALAC